jgi:hypothetical protein
MPWDLGRGIARAYASSAILAQLGRFSAKVILLTRCSAFAGDTDAGNFLLRRGAKRAEWTQWSAAGR